jgi:hypothetical protein
VVFEERKATLLKAMLESSIQRRFPKGLKVHVHSLDRFGCLAALTRVLQQVRGVGSPAVCGKPAWQPCMGVQPGAHRVVVSRVGAGSRLGSCRQAVRARNVLHHMQAGLSITRAKVRTFATSNSSGHTFYVMDATGGPPDR